MSSAKFEIEDVVKSFVPYGLHDEIQSLVSRVSELTDTEFKISTKPVVISESDTQSYADKFLNEKARLRGGVNLTIFRGEWINDLYHGFLRAYSFFDFIDDRVVVNPHINNTEDYAVYLIDSLVKALQYQESPNSPLRYDMDELPFDQFISAAISFDGLRHYLTDTILGSDKAYSEQHQRFKKKLSAKHNIWERFNLHYLINQTGKFFETSKLVNFRDMFAVRTDYLLDTFDTLGKESYQWDQQSAEHGIRNEMQFQPNEQVDNLRYNLGNSTFLRKLGLNVHQDLAAQGVTIEQFLKKPALEIADMVPKHYK